MDDLEIEYSDLAAERGRWFASNWYIWHVLRAVPGLVFLSIIWRLRMLHNYVKIAFRNIWKHKGISFLNVMGLAVGLAVFILISLYVHYELSYDRYHMNTDHVYRIYQDIPYLNNIYAVTSAPLAEALMQELPEIEQTVRIAKFDKTTVYSDNQSFFEDGLIMADPQVFDVFSFPLLQGEPSTALNNPLSVVISQSMARKYFGLRSPMGVILKFTMFNRELALTVTGVFKDIPRNSHFTADFFMPFESQEEFVGKSLRWGNNAYYTYIMLRPEANPQTLEFRLATIDFIKHSGEGYNLHNYGIQSIKDIHLHSHLAREIEPTESFSSVILFSFIAFFILIVACINAMNLAAARATTRLKEVGLRKVIGAQKKQLAWQFFSESFIMTLCAFISAVVLVYATLPAFRNLVERPVTFQPFQNFALLLTLIASVLFTAVLSGVHPALIFSSFKPVSLLRKSSARQFKSFNLRNGLVVFQFTVSIILIVCTLVARNQLHFLRNRDMGYDRNHIVALPIEDASLVSNLQSLKTELRGHTDILTACISSSMPDHVPFRMDATRPKRPDGEAYSFYTIDTDDGFVDVYGMDIVQGRNFSFDFPSDQEGAFLINETTAKELDWDDPVGKTMALIGRRRGMIVGVVKDFHIQSMSQPIEPLALYLKPESQRWYWRHLSVKIRPENIPSTLKAIEEILHRFAPHYPFDYAFFDDVFDRTFKAEQKMGDLFRIFAGLAVLIACLGLFGLASFSAQKRVKEIGIRKVLGASVPGIVVLLGQEFLKWVILANAVAWPIGYFVMHRWLQNFAYRTHLTIDIFVLSGLSALVIAFSTVCIQTMKAAKSNPVDSLRYE